MKIMQGMAVCGLIAAGVLGTSSEASAQSALEGKIIVNEYNAVGPTKTLGNGQWDPAFGSGPVSGNGGDWIELVVVENLPANSLVGLQIVWSNGDSPAKSGTLELKNVTPWTQAFKKGTIITLRVGDTNDWSLNYCPDAGAADVWLRANASDTSIITSTGNAFQTDNDDWQVSLVKSGLTVQDDIGESATLWAGTGLGSDEVAKLQEDVGLVSSVTPYDQYVDGNCSSFGAPNCWHPSSDAGAGAVVVQNIVAPSCP